MWMSIIPGTDLLNSFDSAPLLFLDRSRPRHEIPMMDGVDSVSHSNSDQLRLVIRMKFLE